MIPKEKLKSLAGEKNNQGLILSVFLSTSRLDDWRQTAPSFINSELARLTKDKGLTKDERKVLQDNLKKILDVLQYELTPQTQGLSIFANGSLFERIELPVRLSNRLVLENSPYLRPLVHALFQLEPFVLVRVSRDDSSIYVVDEWRLTREDDFAGPHLKSTDKETGEEPVKEYYAAARQETLVEQHFKEVSTALDRLLDETGIRRVVLCGQHEIVSNFRKSLTQKAEQRVRAEIPWDPAASVNQLLVMGREAVQQAHKNEMEQLARTILDNRGSQGLSVAGFDETMAALQRGQLQTLLIDYAFRPEGWRCLSCDYAGIAPVEACPVCGGETAPVSDVGGEAVRMAVLQGTTVEVAQDVDLMAELGGIGGVLRYR